MVMMKIFADTFNIFLISLHFFFNANQTTSIMAQYFTKMTLILMFFFYHDKKVFNFHTTTSILYETDSGLKDL